MNNDLYRDVGGNGCLNDGGGNSCVLMMGEEIVVS